MRKLLPIFISCFALLSVNACAGGDEEDPVADAAPAAPDANTSPDAMQGGGGAASLGQVCNMATPCPDGLVCATLEMGATSGMCTISCTMQGMVDVCGNGFPGPGLAYCGLGSSPNFACAVGCGEQAEGNTSCPTGLTCKDLIQVNGTGDLCAP